MGHIFSHTLPPLPHITMLRNLGNPKQVNGNDGEGTTASTDSDQVTANTTNITSIQNQVNAITIDSDQITTNKNNITSNDQDILANATTLGNHNATLNSHGTRLTTTEDADTSCTKTQGAHAHGDREGKDLGVRIRQLVRKSVWAACSCWRLPLPSDV